MNNQLVSEENITKTPPQWPRVNIPGNAVQGSILLTVNQFVEPPQDASNLKWLAMEDIIGTANVKMEYDEKQNLFNFYKAKGHLNNNKTWVYEWTLFATIAGISEEVQEELKNLVYVAYRYDTSIPNTLVVSGIKKDGVSELLCNISFVNTQEFAIAVNNLSTQITSEITRATDRENQIAGDLNSEITRATDRENQIAGDLNNEITRATDRENQIAGDLNSEITRATDRENQIADDLNNEITRAIQSEQTLQDSINNVRENLAEYIGNFETKAALDAYIGQVNNNDYAVVLDDETHENQCWRYIYNKSTHTWLPQYMVNEQPMTQEQVRAINSGINATRVALIDQNRISISNINTEIAELQTEMGELQGELTPGNGIDITNNVISVKNGNGINVNENGINVTTGNTTEIISNKVEVKPNEGLTNTINGLSINANFNNKLTPLESNQSGLAKYSDGKIGVDFPNIQLKLTQLLNTPTQITIGHTVNIPDLEKYGEIKIRINNVDGDEEGSGLYFRNESQFNIICNSSSVVWYTVGYVDWTNKTIYVAFKNPIQGSTTNVMWPPRIQVFGVGIE